DLVLGEARELDKVAILLLLWLVQLGAPGRLEPLQEVANGLRRRRRGRAVGDGSGEQVIERRVRLGRQQRIVLGEHLLEERQPVVEASKQFRPLRLRQLPVGPYELVERAAPQVGEGCRRVRQRVLDEQQPGG